MTNRKPRMHLLRWVPAGIVCWLLLMWALGAFAHAYAAEKHRGPPPTSEMVRHCENGGVGLCAPSERVTVELTERRREALRVIHKGFRRDVRHGWGDCDWYVSSVIEALLHDGWPAGSLTWASGWTADGRHHAWLVVSTSDGEMALDSRRKYITRAAYVVEYSRVKACRWVDVAANRSGCFQ